MVNPATSRTRSFRLCSILIPRRGSDQSPSEDIERDSTIRIPEAWAVTDDNENDEERGGPIVDAIPMQMTWWQRYQRLIIGGMCLLLVGSAVAVGVSLASENSADSNGQNQSVGFAPSTFKPSQSAAPVNLCVLRYSLRHHPLLQK